MVHKATDIKAVETSMFQVKRQGNSFPRSSSNPTHVSVQSDTSVTEDSDQTPKQRGFEAQKTSEGSETNSSISGQVANQKPCDQLGQEGDPGDPADKPDCYVVAKLCKKKKRTPFVPDSTSPRWDCTMTFVRPRLTFPSLKSVSCMRR